MPESFVGFFELNEGVTGEAVADTIEQAIAACNFDFFLPRGQAYDGASNKLGKYKGYAVILKGSCYIFPLLFACFKLSCSEYLRICTGTKSFFAVAGKVYQFFDNHRKC